MPSEKLGKYTPKIKVIINKKLTNQEQSSGYNITFNNSDILIAWPTKDNYKTWQPSSYAFTLNIGHDQTSGSIKIEFKYSAQKKLLDNPNNGAKSSALEIPIGKAKIIPNEWKNYQITSEINGSWGFHSDFVPYVTYKPVTIEKYIPKKKNLTLCWILLPKLGFNYQSGTFEQQKTAFLAATNTNTWPKFLKDMTSNLGIRPFYIESN